MKRRSFLKMLATTCCAVAVGLEFALPTTATPQGYPFNKPDLPPLINATFDEIYDVLFDKNLFVAGLVNENFVRMQLAT